MRVCVCVRVRACICLAPCSHHAMPHAAFRSPCRCSRLAHAKAMHNSHTLPLTHFHSHRLTQTHTDSLALNLSHTLPSSSFLLSHITSVWGKYESVAHSFRVAQRLQPKSVEKEVRNCGKSFVGNREKRLKSKSEKWIWEGPLLRKEAALRKHRLCVHGCLCGRRERAARLDGPDTNPGIGAP